MNNIIKIMPILLSAGAVILTLINMAQQFKDYFKSKAPFLILEKCLLNKVPPDTYSFDETLNYEKRDIAQFTLDSRCFLKKGETGSEYVTLYSLIMDTRFLDNSQYNPKKAYGETKCINFGTITVRNIGFDMIKFRLDLIRIYFLDGNVLDLAPNMHSKLYVYLKSDSKLDFALSYIFYNNDYALFLPEIFNDNYLQRKSADVGEDLFNSYIPEISENYNKMEFFLTTSNKYNKDYKQKIILSVDHNVHYAETKMG